MKQLIAKTFYTGILFGCLILVGCGSYEYGPKGIPATHYFGKQYKSDRPVCELNSTEYNLDVQMVSFEVTSSGGFGMQFSLLDKLLNLFKLKFKAKTGELKLEFTLSEPLRPGESLVSVLGKSKMKSREFKFNFDFDQINAGVDYFSQTPIATLAEKGMDNAYGNLREVLNQDEEPWSSNVVARPVHDEVVINAGSFMGVRPGDAFNIYNVQHIWRGANGSEGMPCASEYLMSRKTTQEPLALGYVIQVEKKYSLLKIEYLSEEQVQDGALVEIAELVEPNRTLKRTLKIRSVQGGVMYAEGGKSLDLTPFLTHQIKSVTNRHHFIVVE